MADSVTDTLPAVEETAPGADINSPTGANGLFLVCKTDGFAEFYDPKTLARCDAIKLPDFPHEVVLSPDRTTAFVSNHDAGSVTILDLAAMKPVGRFATHIGAEPMAFH